MDEVRFVGQPVPADVMESVMLAILETMSPTCNVFSARDAANAVLNALERHVDGLCAADFRRGLLMGADVARETAEQAAEFGQCDLAATIIARELEALAG